VSARLLVIGLDGATLDLVAPWAAAGKLPVLYHGHSALEQELPTYVAGPVSRRGMARLGRLLDAQVPRRADFCIAVTEALGAHLRRTGVRDQSLACIEPAGAPDELAATRSTRRSRGSSAMPATSTATKTWSSC
jgi:hypothetical protein